MKNRFLSMSDFGFFLIILVVLFVGLIWEILVYVEM